MDDGRFDRLAKTVAGTSSRRRLLRRALAAAPLALGVSALRGREPVAAAKHRAHAQGKGKGKGKGNVCKVSGQICGGIGNILGECCHGLTCFPGPFLHSCQRLCDNDNQCHAAYPHTQTSCSADLLACPSLNGVKCCVPHLCVTDADCAKSFTCKDLVCRKEPRNARAHE